MLKNLDDKVMTKVPHEKEFREVLQALRPERAAEARAALDEAIDDVPAAPGTGRRVFSSSHLGSRLSPWTGGLKHLYDVAEEQMGENAEERDVQDRAALIFGCFVWERLMERDGEEWVFYDPNLSARDPNRQIIGKTYFEQP